MTNRQQVTFRCPKGLLDKIDTQVEKKYFGDRSEFIVTAVREKLRLEGLLKDSSDDSCSEQGEVAA